MKLILKKTEGKKRVQEIERKLNKRKRSGGFNAKKYNGILPGLEEDALALQKRMRDEWERNNS
ncbi:MAG: hypothetical protein KF687_11085 [Cyclobacteriaceae bacterium]|nr:hypothetical protein [Cyclobacteriaceae bacterium]